MIEPVFENIQAKGTNLPEQAAEQISKLIVEQHLTCEDKIPSEFELAEIRLQMEPWVARMAAERATVEDLKNLREACGVVEQDILAERDHAKSDVAFHVATAECTHNLVVPKLIPIITYAITLFVSLTESRLKAQTLVDHREILDAVCDRDGERAAETMERHIRYNKTMLEELVLELKQANKAGS